MVSRITKIAIGVIVSPFIIAVAIVILLPIVFLIFLGRLVGHLWYVSRLRAAWPSGKFVLIAYTESQLWAPYIEKELLPQINEHCIVVNRSREDWKREFRAEGRALAFWGGSRSYNPIAVVLRPWGRVRVFRLYDPFKELKHGQPAPLETIARELVQCIRETANVRT
jgi:hypothetical protein